MKAKRFVWFLLFLMVSADFQLPAQQSEGNRKLLADMRAKAEYGDAQSQCEWGSVFFSGNPGMAQLEGLMTREQIAEGRKLAHNVKLRGAPPAGGR